MQVRHAYAIRWGDQQNSNVVLAQTFTSAELFRVTASIPQVWKIAFGLFVANAANLGISPALILNVGVGSSQREETIPFPVNAFNTLEMPGLMLIGRIRGTPLANDRWSAHGYLAPFFPVGEFT